VTDEDESPRPPAPPADPREGVPQPGAVHITMPLIDFSEPAPDPLTGVRKGMGLGDVGVTGPTGPAGPPAEPPNTMPQGEDSGE
jgi:hypothetical protein